MRSVVGGLVLVGMLALSGCVEGDRIPSLPPTPTSTPIFASEEEALAAAEEAYAAYLEMSNLISSEGGVDPETDRPLVTEERLADELRGFETFRDLQLPHRLDRDTFEMIEFQRLDQTGDSAEVVFYVCWDTSAVTVLDSAGADVTPPERNVRRLAGGGPGDRPRDSSLVLSFGRTLGRRAPASRAAILFLTVAPRSTAHSDCTTLEETLGVCVKRGRERGDTRRTGISPRGGWLVVLGHSWGQGPLWQRPRPYGTARCVFLNSTQPEVCVRPESAADIPTITINDIATFRPIPGRQQMEPDGWTVAGLDTNFFAITDPHIVNGTLLGRPADVRFTPVAYRWAYGDGSAAVKSTKGGTWAALGIPEFDPTPTSHVYERLGDYTITLSITFAAEYRFAGSAWRPVVGRITLPANDLYLRVGSAQTVLVEHDCTENPSGPGC